MRITQDDPQYAIHLSKEEMIRLYVGLRESVEERGDCSGPDKDLQENFRVQMNVFLSKQEKWDHCTEIVEPPCNCPGGCNGCCKDYY
jgi:hypothetical protein